MNYSLEDLIDIPLLQELQDKLNRIYSFPSAIIDNNGKVLTAVAWQDVCTKFHRTNPQCEKECIMSDKYILEHIMEANPAVSYKCPHGLIDNATPIIIDGKHLGNFFTGQFFLEKPDLEYFKQQAKKYGFNEKEYIEAVNKVPIWTKEKLTLYLDFIKGFIEVIAGIGLKKLKEIETSKILKESEARNNSIIQSTSDWIWEIDKNGKYCYCSERVEKFLGYTSAEMIGKSPFDFMSYEESEKVSINFKKIVEAKANIVDLENWNLHKDGHRVCLLTNGFPVFDTEQNLIGYRGADKDITDRKISEEDLQNAYTKLRSFVDSNIVGVLVATPDGKILEANDYFLNLIGYSREEFNNGEVNWRKLTPDEWIPADEKAISEMRKTGKCTPYEKEYLRRDGTRVSILLSDALLQGKEEHIIAFAVDITYRKNIEIELQESHAKYQFIVENTNDILWTMTPDFNLDYVSPSVFNFLGYTQEEHLKHTLDDFVTPDSAKLVRDEFSIGMMHFHKKEYDKLRNFAELEIEYIKKDKTHGFAIISMVFLRDKNYNLLKINGKTTDITERIITQKKLKESEEKFRAVSEYSFNSICIINESGKIVWANQAMVNMGMFQIEMIYAADSFTAFIAPESLEFVVSNFMNFVKGEEYVHHYEFYFIRGDGEKRLCEKHMSHFKDSNGKLNLVISMLDVTENRKALVSLKESEEKYRRLVDTSPDAISLSDLNGNLLSVNQKAIEYFGYPENEKFEDKKRNIIDFIAPSDRERLFENIKKKLTKIEYPTQIYKCIRVNGTQFYAEINSSILCDYDEKPYAMISIVRDVTERQKMENALIESNEKFRLSFQTSPDAFYLATLEEGMIIEANDSFEKVFGYSRKEFIGKTSLQLNLYDNPDDRKKMVEELKANGFIKELELSGRRKNGALFIASMSVNTMMLNNNMHIIGVVRDITEQKNAELALKESEETYRTLFEGINDAIFISEFTNETKTNRFIEVNEVACRRYGYSREELLNLTPFDINSEKTKLLLPSLLKGITEKKHALIEVEHVKKDGSIIPVEISTHIIQYKNKTVYQSIARDITERKQIEAKLREKDIEFRKLSANVPDLIFQFTRRPNGSYYVPIASEGIVNIFGCSPEDVLNDFTPIANVIHPDDAERVINDIEYSAKHISNFTCEFRVNIPGKPTQWIYSRSTPEQLPDGSITWYGFNVNITERKLAEQKIKEIEELFTLFMKFSPVYTFIKEVTPTESRVLQASENYKNMIGIPGSEMIGKTMEELFPPEFAAKMTADDWSVVEKGNVFQEDEDLNGLKYTSIKFPIKKEGKNILAGFSIDITERVQTEQILHDIIENNPLSIQIIDDNGYTLKTNNSYLTIFGAIPPIDFSIFTDLEEKGFGKLISKAKNGEIVHFPDILYDVHDVIFEVQSKPIWIKAVLFPVKDKLNKTKQFVFIHEDITERKKAEENLKISEKKFRLLFQNLNVGFALHEIILDKNGIPCDYRFLEINPAFEKLTGLKANNIIGKTATEVIPNIESFWISTYGKVALSGETLNFENYNNDINKYYQVSAYSPEPGKFATVFMDITDRILSEKALKRSEKELKRAQEITHIGSWYLDLRTNEVIWTEELYKMYGFDSSLPPPPYSEHKKLFTPESWDLLSISIENTSKTGTSYELELKTLKNDNSNGWMWVRGETIKDPNGKIIGLWGAAQDITQRKLIEIELEKAKEKVEDSERNLLEAQKTAHIGHWEWNLIRQKLVWSDEIFNIFGVEKETFEVSAENFEKTIHPEDLKEFLEKREKGLTNDNEINLDHRIIRPNGEIRFVHEHSKIIRDNNGQVVSVFGTVQDITDQKITEIELQQAKEKAEESESVLQLIIDNFPNANATLLDNNLNVILTGGSEYFKYGFNPKNLRNKHVSEILSKDNYDKLKLNIDKAINGESSNYEVEYKDGVFYMNYVTPIKFSEDKISYFLIANINITDLKQTQLDLIKAKEKAEESDRLKSAFLANMSHEIRTPMNGILGFAELLKLPDLKTEKQQDYIKIIEESGNRMLNIINDIINISKVEAGLMDLTITETNINKQLEYVYSFFKPEVEGKGLKLIMNKLLPNNNVIINTDTQKFSSILTNLLKNAIKFTTEGYIEIGFTKKDDFLEFFVKDTGIGIPLHQKDLVFERFRQGSEQLNRKYEGSGLGLSISKAYVEMMGGKIWLKKDAEKSDNKNGSEFYFTLPYNPVYEEKIETISESVASISKRKRIKKLLKVLIVEDDKTSMEFNKITVEEFSNEILYAVNGNEAITYCKQNPDIDLILMDIKLPDLDGYEATQQIRQFNKKVVIIAQTAFALAGDREKAIKAGCNDYLPKPYNKSMLSEKIMKYFLK